jgi:hypothetical protein
MQRSIIYSQEHWLLFQIIWRQPCDEMDFFPIISLAAVFIPGLETKLLCLNQPLTLFSSLEHSFSYTRI